MHPQSPPGQLLLGRLSHADTPIDEELVLIVRERDAVPLFELLDTLNEDLNSGTRKVELTHTMV